MNEILIEHNVRKQIIAMYGVSYPTIRAALKGKSHTLLALKIRKTAIKFGGREVKDVNNNQ